MCPRLHDKIALLHTSLGKEGNVTVKDVDLTALVSDKFGTEENADATNHRAADNGGYNGEKG
jgi:hypothetical protein